MPLVTRQALFPEDAQAMWTAWSWAFRHKAPEEPFEGPDEGEKWLLAELGGAPVSMCAVYDYQVRRADAVLSCGGVAGVATPPEHRQKGYGSQFMRDVLRTMRDDGHMVTSLYAFRDPFYAKLGYATCGWRWKIVCPSERLPHLRSDLPVRQLDAAEVFELDGVYSKFSRPLAGSVVRTEKQWKDRMGKTPPMIYAIGDPIEAYAWAKITDFWANVEIGECAWSTPRGYDAVLALFRSLAHNQKSVTWCEPPQSPFLARHMDRDVEASFYRQTMHRVLDVPGAIAALKPESSGDFTIEVEDSILQENSCAWQVWFDSTGANATKCKTGDLKMNIGAFSQAYMGSPTVIALADQGLVEVRSTEALHAAQRLFSPTQVCCMDFF